MVFDVCRGFRGRYNKRLLDRVNFDFAAMIKTQTSFPHRFLLVFCAVVLGWPLTGCRDDSIVVYESVPITRNIDSEEDADPKYRMVTAIAEQPEATWFFKISGPIENFEGVTEGWSEFLDSIRFASEEPDWKLPEALMPIDFALPRILKSTFRHLYIRFIKEPIASYSANTCTSILL